MKQESIAVFCGSQAGKSPSVVDFTALLGNYLGTTNRTLIYGGGQRGLMGIIANASLATGGHVVGIIPQLLMDKEVGHIGIQELIVVPDMHTRKRLLYEKCDAAVILPGGFGTMDELFELLTWNNLKIHDKPIYLCNIDGFYDPLLAHFEMMQREGFLYTDWHERLTTVRQLEDLLACLEGR